MSNKTIIIAEAGVNHNGDMDLAKKLIDAAQEANSDYVKFQTFKAEDLVAKSAAKADYQKKNDPKEESQFQMLKKLELSFGQQRELKDYSKGKISFLSSPFDIKSAKFLDELDLDYIKIPSGELTNLPLLEVIASFRRKVILSTGMSYLDEVKSTVDVLMKHGLSSEQIVLLHCNTEYPTPLEDVNLRAMLTMKEKLGLPIGYSDHTMGINVALAAVSLGAILIEKHFTLDRNLPGPDHLASLSPSELKLMVDKIREIERVLGSPIKEPSPSEVKNRSIARKSIVAKTSIQKGEIFTTENLAVKRPGTGISPMKWHDIVGKKSEKDYAADDLI